MRGSTFIPMRDQIKTYFPGLLAHEGKWKGEYIHQDLHGNILDRHDSKIECIFPQDGQEAYIQKNEFTWANGVQKKYTFGSTIKNNRLLWDTDSFFGSGWSVSPSIFILELTRKDKPDTHFTEIILLKPDSDTRVRTWHWYKGGICFKRTCCNERRH